MIDGVIFDMDGLMFDTEPIWTRVWAPVLATIGREYPHGLANAVRGTSGASMEAVLGRFVPGADTTYIREAAYAMVHEELRKGAPKKPGLDELLAFLAEQGVPMAVASSSALVASSSSRIGASESSARAMATRWAWPSERPTPRSPSLASSPISCTNSSRQAALTACSICASVGLSVNRVILSRRVPDIRVLPWGT